MRPINARPGYQMSRNVVRKLHKGAEAVTWHGEKPRLTKYSARVIISDGRTSEVQFLANYPDGHDQSWLVKKICGHVHWFPLG